MNIKLKESFKYGIVVPTSMGIRMTPENGQPVYTADAFKVSATSAETNVVTISSSLGYPAMALTAFVKDSPIAKLIKGDLLRRNISYLGKEYEQGGPWGLRHQFNIADSGFGARGPCVHNDRAGEVGRHLSAKDFDLDKIFGQDGAGILHLSGLIAALSDETAEFCMEVCRSAKKYGTLVSFDLNYRQSFWKGREKHFHKVFDTIAKQSDILIGNEEDFQLCLGINGPDAGGKDLLKKSESFMKMIKEVSVAYPNASVIATTLRDVLSANTHLWGSIAAFGDDVNYIPPREIGVLDRIGGGDGFVGGLLYGIIKGWEAKECNEFAWGAGALAASMLTDYAIVSSEEQIKNIYEGNARVKR